MNMTMQLAPPRRPPGSPRRRVLSPSKKQRPSLSLIPTTRRSSRALTSDSTSSRALTSDSTSTGTDGPDNDFDFSDKNALFQSFPDLGLDGTFSDTKNALFESFSDLCLDDFCDEEEEEKEPQKQDFMTSLADFLGANEEKDPQKQEFMASLVEFLGADDCADDSEFKKCIDWQTSTDAVAGITKEEVEFNTSLASLFGSITDLLTNKRAFDEKECSSLKQEMERLQKMRRRMATAAESKPDFSGFPEAPHSPTARSRNQPILGRGSPKKSNLRSVTPVPGQQSSLTISPRHPSKQRDPSGAVISASSGHSKSPRKRSGLTVTLHRSSSKKGDSMSLSSHTSRPMPVPRSPRKSSRTLGQSDPTCSPIAPRKSRSGASSPTKYPKSPRKSLPKDPLGVLDVSESNNAVQLHGTPRRSTGKGPTGRIRAKSERNLIRVHDRSDVPDCPKTVSSRSSRGGRSRAESPRRTTLSRDHEMFSNGEDLGLVPTVYSSSEKEDLAPRQPSRGEFAARSRGRRSSQERKPISRNRTHSVVPDAERKSRSSTRGCSAIATSGSRRRSSSVAPETGSSRVRSTSVAPETGSSSVHIRSNGGTRDAEKSSARSHLDLLSRSQHHTRRRPSSGSLQNCAL